MDAVLCAIDFSPTTALVVRTGQALARAWGARLIAFPELALTGYFVGHRYHEAALRLDSKEIEKLVAATKGTAVVVLPGDTAVSILFIYPPR